MIPAMNIIAWGHVAPWAEQRQIEQDLVISRALVEMFSDAFLREELLFRGGTALNKLHFPEPFRYSEDIDLAHAIGVFDGLDTRRVVDICHRYLALQELTISRAQAEQRMFAKLATPGFLADLRSLLAAPQAERLTDKAVNEAFACVFTGLITQLSGNAWARTGEMIERFGLALANAA